MCTGIIGPLASLTETSTRPALPGQRPGCSLGVKPDLLWTALASTQVPPCNFKRHLNWQAASQFYYDPNAVRSDYEVPLIVMRCPVAFVSFLLRWKNL